MKLKVWQAFSRAVASLHQSGILRTDLDDVNRAIYDPVADMVNFSRRSQAAATRRHPATVDDLARNLVPLMQFVVGSKKDEGGSDIWQVFEESYTEAMDQRGPQVIARLRVLRGELRRASELNMKALGLAHLGKLEEARAAFQESIRVREESGDDEGACRTLCNLALLSADARDFDTAFTDVDRAVATAREHGRTTGLCLALFQKGLLLNRQGKRDAALQQVDLAIRTWEGTGQPLPAQFVSLSNMLRKGTDKDLTGPGTEISVENGEIDEPHA